MQARKELELWFGDVRKRQTTHTVKLVQIIWICLFMMSYLIPMGLRNSPFLLSCHWNSCSMSRMSIEHDGKCHGYFLLLPFLCVNRNPAFFSCLLLFFHAVLSLSLPLFPSFALPLKRWEQSPIAPGCLNCSCVFLLGIFIRPIYLVPCHRRRFNYLFKCQGRVKFCAILWGIMSKLWQVCVTSETLLFVENRQDGTWVTRRDRN